MSSIPVPPELSALQARLGLALRDGATPALWPLFSEPPDVAARRFAAYRRNVTGNWRSALNSTYPVLAALIGAQRFSVLADQYLAGYPSQSGDLNAYGGELATLLAASPLSTELPYLPDMARLEWGLLAAYGAVDPAVFDFAALAAIPAPAQAELRLLVWVGATLSESNYPLVAIWQAHQLTPVERDKALADIDAGSSAAASCRMLTVRIDGNVSVLALSAGEYAFLTALRVGQALAEAIASALAAEAAFNPGAALQRFVGLHTLTGFSIPGGKK